MIYQKCIIAYIKINGRIWHWKKQTFIVSFKEDVIAKNLPVEGAILQQSAFMGSFSSFSCHLHLLLHVVYWVFLVCLIKRYFKH